MLQDLEFGRLENEYRPLPPGDDDYVLCFRGADVLLHRAEDGALTLPTVSRFPAAQLRYAFRLHDRSYYLLSGETVEAPAPFVYEPARALRQTVSKEVCYAVLTGWHLFCWYRSNRFCGRCGSAMAHGETERSQVCPDCGNTVYPKICPAVIVAVHDRDRLVLTRYRGRPFKRHALVAGYNEIGESIEDTVRREVLEEVGLRVKNLRFYKSQPWTFTDTLLMGFYAELDGDDTITMQEDELSEALWFPRAEIPQDYSAISLTGEMIEMFRQGKM